MSATEAAETAELLTTAREALERFIDVHVDDDGALTFSHGDVPCAVQATRLGDGLTMLILTCVVGWDLVESVDLAVAVAERAGQGLFGTLGVGHSDNGVDVTLRYTFPGAGLDVAALGTLLMLVVSTASQLRTELPGIVPGETGANGG